MSIEIENGLPQMNVESMGKFLQQYRGSVLLSSDVLYSVFRCFDINNDAHVDFYGIVIFLFFIFFYFFYFFLFFFIFFIFYFFIFLFLFCRFW